MWRILKSSISSYLVTLRYVLAFVLWTISLFVAVFVYTGWMPTTKDNYFEKTAVAAALILFCQTIGAFLLCSLRWKKATRFSLDLGTSAMTYVPRRLCIVCVWACLSLGYWGVFPWCYIEVCHGLSIDTDGLQVQVLRHFPTYTRMYCFMYIRGICNIQIFTFCPCVCVCLCFCLCRFSNAVLIDIGKMLQYSKSRNAFMLCLCICRYE